MKPLTHNSCMHSRIPSPEINTSTQFKDIVHVSVVVACDMLMRHSVFGHT